MGQSKPFVPLALIVEDDALQRSTISDLLEDEHVQVIQCESAEAAELVLGRYGEAITMLLTDVNLAGSMSGIELAKNARAKYPNLHIVIVSGRPQEVSSDIRFILKPWQPLEIVREALRFPKRHS
jgi:CheY-like chemotaxis protein